jgi:hypothetical protein
MDVDRMLRLDSQSLLSQAVHECILINLLQMAAPQKTMDAKACFTNGVTEFSAEA